MRISTPLTLLLLAAPAVSQAHTYEAGIAGAPPVAPDPLDQGWTGGATAPTTVKDVSPDPAWGINAWQITDPGSGCAHYHAPLMAHMFDVGYIFEAEVRMLAGDSVYLGIATGYTLLDSLWEMTLDPRGGDVVVADSHANQTICPGGADGQYHTFAMLNPTGANIVDLDLYYDGVLVGVLYEEIGWVTAVEGIAWGTGKYLTTWSGCGDPDPGRARFHRVQFRTLDHGALGNNYCGPAVPNSSGMGAVISATGIAVAAHNDLTLTASQMPVDKFGYLLASQTQGFVAGPGGSQGNLCLGGTIGRFTQQIRSTGSTGMFSIDVDLTAIPTSPPHSVMPGETWNFQAWFRDVNPQGTSNFTDGVSIQFM